MLRLFDVIISGVLLILLAPLLLPVVFILRITGEGEVFYFQERVGRDGKFFKLFKFATMLKNSPSLGTGTVTMKNDPRVLPIGVFLRRSKINELPQLLNVFFGSMSLVGPRPQARKNFDAFPIDVQKIVTTVRPGLSGLGSIIFRNEEDILADRRDPVVFYNSVIAPYKGNIEVWYVNNRSVAAYFAILFVTLLVILFPLAGLVWRVFRDLPEPPDELRELLNFPSV